MSYLERLLTRAGVLPAESAAGAAPRLPSWFESEMPGADDLGAGRPPGAVAAPAPAPGAAPAPASGQPSAAPAPPTPSSRSAVAGVPVGDGGDVGRPSAQLPSPAATRTPALPTAPDAVGPAPRREQAGPAAPHGPARPARVLADPRPALVPPLRTGAPAPTGGAQQREMPAAPDVVQVSIGRVEVRATIAAPPPGPAAAPTVNPPPQDDPTDVLSLADYLHGKRGVR